MTQNIQVGHCKHNGRRAVDQDRIDIKALSLQELQEWFVGTLNETPERALRVYKHLWQRGARTFDEMDNIPKSVRAKLSEQAEISFLEPSLILKSADGTVKFLWKLMDGHTIESVLIPDGERVTLCMSSQVGCAMKCSFCLTGDMGLKRHLNAAEIANQALQVGQQIQLDEKRITNLVFMGMGEPLHNLKALVPAIENCLDDNGLNFSHRKVTVSTVGLVPKMAELAAKLPVNLAVSINATTEEQRREIMPITRKYSLEDLLQGCREFPLPNNKKITFEYVMLGGFNDSLDDAVRLMALLEGIPSKVNLIPYNENPERNIRRPSDETVKAFQHYFVSRGEHCSIRTTRGIDISAACGQLGDAWSQARDLGLLQEARKIAGLAKHSGGAA